MSEHAEQAAFITWCAYNEARFPELAWMYAIPNGGHRHKAVAAKMKAEGAKAGVLDLCLPVPRGPYHGLYLETKYGKNKPSPEQERWIAFLRSQGHYVEVCWGCEELIRATEKYLALPTLTFTYDFTRKV